MQSDPRITTALALAQQRGHPYYAAAAWRLARDAGDLAAMEEALSLGAANYRPAARVYARTDGDVVQLTFFEATEPLVLSTQHAPPVELVIAAS